jgi:hypothetical protein
VNLASHLLVDVLTGTVDAAVAISNDSDLRFRWSSLVRGCPWGSSFRPGTTSREPFVGTEPTMWEALVATTHRDGDPDLPTAKSGRGFIRPVGW